MAEVNALTAISPVDGRYRKVTNPLAEFFSESALIKYRVFVEIEYFIALCELPLSQLSSFPKATFADLRKIYQEFDEDDALAVKEIEKVTNHDVKAVEYFIKDKLTGLGIGAEQEFVHFGLTSQDINNTAVPCSVKDAVEKVYLPALEEIVGIIRQKSIEWKNIPMLARTHGQPASPTRLGKEFLVFAERLSLQIDQLRKIDITGKFGGATGNFNAHYVAFSSIDWVGFANTFLKDQLKIKRQQTTTQIEHYDNLAALFDAMKRINTILLDLNRDVWTYISNEFFKQKIKAGEVGSSAMPHKVNPIDFENSEGNIGIANALYEHLSAKLPVSRLQRDLTDSTVLRNVGMPLAHSLLAFSSLKKGLNKLLLNETAIAEELEENWAVVAEAIQTVLRREGYPKPYEALKALTRTNEGITQKSIHEFISELNVSDEIKNELLKITPSNYTGIQLVE